MEKVGEVEVPVLVLLVYYFLLLVYSKSHRSIVSYCLPGFPGALPGFPGSPGVSSPKVQRVSEVSRRSLEDSRS